jgi:hypothetical protein
MPVTLPDVSNSEVKRILQVQDKLIKSIPEVTMFWEKRVGQYGNRQQSD